MSKRQRNRQLDQVMALTSRLTTDEQRLVFLDIYERLCKSDDGLAKLYAPLSSAVSLPDSTAAPLLNLLMIQMTVIDSYMHRMPPVISGSVPNTYVPVTSVQQHRQAGIQAGRQEGIEYALSAIQPFEDAVRRLAASLSMIAGCARCDDGPLTRQMVGEATEEFVASMQAVDKAQREVQAEGLISVGLGKGAVEMCNAIRDVATTYAAAKKDTGQQQALLRSCVAQHFPPLHARLYTAVNDAKKRGGPKGPRPVQAYILQEVRALWYEPGVHRSLAGSAIRFQDTLRREYQALGKPGMKPTIRYDAYMILSRVQDVPKYVEDLDKKYPDTAENG